MARVKTTLIGSGTPGRVKRTRTRVPGSPFSFDDTESTIQPRVDAESIMAIRSPSAIPAPDAGVFGNTRTTTIVPLMSSICMPTPA